MIADQFLGSLCTEQDQPERSRNTSSRVQSTDVVNTRAHSAYGHRPSAGDSSEEDEESVDDIVLPHQDGHGQVANNRITESVRSHTRDCKPDEDRKVDNEDDAEQTAIEVEDLVAEVAQPAGLVFRRENIFPVTCPYGGLIFETRRLNLFFNRDANKSWGI